jgi:hypothetical protein
VLVLADEDYKGVNPTYPPGTNKPKYAQAYVDALKANKIKATVWDIDRDGAPHNLGVLSHFKGVVWYLGDNRLTQDAADEYVPVGSQKFPDCPGIRRRGRRHPRHPAVRVRAGAGAVHRRAQQDHR